MLLVVAPHCWLICRVSNRLYTDAQKKDKKLSEMREKEDHARQEAMHPTAVASLWDRKHGVKRSSGNSGPVGSRAPDLAFYGRQQALLDRRAERARQRRPSDYLTPEEAKECTCKCDLALLACDSSSAASLPTGSDVCNGSAMYCDSYVADTQQFKHCLFNLPTGRPPNSHAVALTAVQTLTHVLLSVLAVWSCSPSRDQQSQP